MLYCRCHYRRNSDESLRNLQRQAMASGEPEDIAKYVSARRRAGEVSDLNIELASELGHPAAQLIMPRPITQVGTRSITDDLFQKLVGSGQTPLVVKVAIEFAIHVLPVWENYSKNLRPYQAIQATIQWTKAPTAENSEAAGYYGNEAYNAGMEADEILRRGRPTQTIDLGAPSPRPGAAARAAAQIAWAVSSLKELPMRAMLTSDAAIYSKEDRYEESQWQKNFLAEILLGLQEPSNFSEF